jgi:hypothetical protein
LQQADSTRYNFETGILVAVNPDLRNTRGTIITVCPKLVGIGELMNDTVESKG